MPRRRRGRWERAIRAARGQGPGMEHVLVGARAAATMRRMEKDRRPDELPRLPRDPEDDFSVAAVGARRVLAEEAAGRELVHLAGLPVPCDQARGKIENLVGYAQIPVGLAGPQRVDTTLGTVEVYVPMATTEGAMTASYSRGMACLREAGGARARLVREGLTQNPILVYEDSARALAAAREVRALEPGLVRIVADITKHGKLVRVEPEVLGRRLVVRLVFTTGDAIGINMAARAADLCAAAIEERTAAQARYVHGQDVEKRANARALIEGRGRSVVCDAHIPRDVLERRLRCTPEDLVQILTSYRVGFAQLGTQNWLVQAANGLAAVLLACGQDVAYVAESATGMLDFEVEPDGGLYAGVHLPSLLVGTVGGGSAQGTAAECLALLGCSGEGKAGHFAELLAATVLAGDLSLMAAFCTHEFVAAHEKLGRNRPGTSP